MKPTSTSAGIVFLLATLGLRLAADEPDLSERLLGLTDEARIQLVEAEQRGVIEIAPVHLPVNPPGDCNHYGWPIATMAGETIVVMHRRIPGHNPRGAGGPNKKMSYGIVLYSDDGGQTWSLPYDLRDCMKPEDRNRGGIVPLSHRAQFDKGNKSPLGYKVHLHAIGTTRDGAVVAINNHGVFRSEDKGRTWRHFSEALRDDTFPHQIINLGPRILDHPQHGLLAFGNWFGEVDSYQRVELWLWSLEPADWGTGQWRRECRLLARQGKFYSTADGFHPAGAVIDEKRRVQHIFIFAGHPNGPAGVYRITRNLDTPKLVASLRGLCQNESITPSSP